MRRPSDGPSSAPPPAADDARGGEEGAAAGSPILRVVLLGFMAAGKSTVGPLLAEELGWSFVDLDAEIEREAGRRIAEIFAADGEPVFRALESACTSAVAQRAATVVAVGGGWIVTPGNLERLGRGTLTVWLQVTPDSVLDRLGPEPRIRPLLAGSDSAGAVRRLLAEREAHYRRAALHVPTDTREPAEIAREIAQLIRAREARRSRAENQE